VPAERHLHYDAEGTYTGHTVIERESRLDDVERADIIALLTHDREVCQCNFHPSVAQDPEATFTPDTYKCPVCAGQAVWQRVLSEQDQAVKSDAPAKQPRPSDGRHSYMRFASRAEVEQAATQEP
jgi:hypothetical protein